ncbi:hypothetical protein [Nonomuraea insulae]|uniref:Uncharacterized protein n=1 Tax=Nonomuraea insulae TaxID=1616787 RepID=A0ABW1DDW4_9ACTN
MPQSTLSQHGADGFLLPWHEYSNDDIFVNLQNIRDFRVIAQYPHFLGDPKPLQESIADRLYEETYAILAAAKLNRFDSLKRLNEDNDLAIRYTDDDHGFVIVISADGTLKISRTGSSLERFYRWYTMFMPHMNDLVAAVTQEYEGALNRRHGSELRVTPTRATYGFSFLLHTFKKAAGRKRERNSRLLNVLLTKVPGKDGHLVSFTEDLFPELGRVDISISRWNSSPAGIVREVFNMEAPSNRDYGALWLDFSFIGETAGSEAPPREIVDFDAFFGRYDIPINDFLQRHCLSNFLSNLTEGLTFESSTGWLP